MSVRDHRSAQVREQAREQAESARSAMQDQRVPLLMAEHIRDALEAFDRLTGRASTEDMLDNLFGGFCIGK